MASTVSETSALLADHGLRDNILTHADTYASEEEAAFKSHPELHTTAKLESLLLFKYSAPLILTYLLQYSLNLVTVFVAGRLGTDELGAASLATTTVNITGLCVYEGLATSLDTLTSQAFGAGKKQLVGLHVQRMVAFLAVVTVPIAACWLTSPWWLALIVPEPKVARLAGRFVQIYLLGAPGYAAFEAGKRFVQAQGNFTAALVVLVVVTPINVLLNWLLVFWAGLGFSGAALAVAISMTLQPLFLVVYIRFFAPSSLQCWPGLQLRSAFRRWRPMVQLALPGVLMTFSEWFAFDILTFSASYLSTAHLAAQSVLMTISVTMYHIPFPISIAAGTRFGNLVGHGALGAARTAFATHYAVFVGIGLLDIIILVTLKNHIAVIFSPDRRVQHIVSATIPVIAAGQFFDATGALSNALLRGLGRQKAGGWLNLAVYYLYAVPLSLGLTFGPPRMELVGLWLGPGSGLVVCTLGLLGYMLWWTDWEEAVKEARERRE